MLEMSDFDALTQPVWCGGDAKSGMTTGPATPFLPLWMWDAVGLPMPLQVMLKQTLPFEGSSVIFAVPFPLGSPLGVSCLPFILTVMVLLAAIAETANDKTASSPSEMSRSFFMPGSSRHRPGAD